MTDSNTVAVLVLPEAESSKAGEAITKARGEERAGMPQRGTQFATHSQRIHRVVVHLIEQRIGLIPRAVRIDAGIAAS